MLYLLAKQKGIHLTREGERPYAGLKYLSAGNATPGAYMGDGLTRNSMNQWPMGHWHSRIAAIYSGIGQSWFREASSILVRDVHGN